MSKYNRETVIGKQNKQVIARGEGGWGWEKTGGNAKSKQKSYCLLPYLLYFYNKQLVAPNFSQQAWCAGA